MKKLFILTIILTILTTFGISAVKADSGKNNVTIIKEAIEKYKNKNYIGCISDLRQYTIANPKSVIAWYYLGNSYMNIAMKGEAHQAFDNVIFINSVPKLTSYSLQAKVCMENPIRCNYQKFNEDQIDKLKADPIAFLDQYFESLNTSKEEQKDIGELEIERLINGYYANNVHPNADDFIKNERIKIKQLKMNSNKV